MAFDEETIINAVAGQEATITGVTNSYTYAANPDSLASAKLPVVLHYFPRFEAAVWGHHNKWRNTLALRSLLFVAPRESRGGKLKFIENDALGFAKLWRQKFQDETVINTLLTTCAATRVFLTSGEYGVGGPELTFGDVEYIGWVFQFEFQSA